MNQTQTETETICDCCGVEITDSRLQYSCECCDCTCCNRCGDGCQCDDCSAEMFT